MSGSGRSIKSAPFHRSASLTFHYHLKFSMLLDVADTTYMGTYGPLCCKKHAVRATGL